MVELVLKHQVIYDIKGNASVSDVANSLLANERLLKYAGMILEDCFEGFTIESVDVRIKEITQNSPLKETLAALLFVTYQKELVKEVPPVIEKMLGVNIPDDYNTLVTVLAMLIAIYGVSAAVKKIFPDKKTDKLKENYDQLIVVVGDYINMPIAKIDNSIKNRFEGSMKVMLQKTGIDFFRPAKREGVRILGPNGNEISRAAVLESPSEVDLSLDDDLEQYSLRNVQVNIRAVDKDRKKQGWAAVIDDVTDKRLKMQVYPSIDPNAIYGRDSINGDVIVVNKKNAEGEFQPNMYHLVKIYD